MVHQFSEGKRSTICVGSRKRCAGLSTARSTPRTEGDTLRRRQIQPLLGRSWTAVPRVKTRHIACRHLNRCTIEYGCWTVADKPDASPTIARALRSVMIRVADSSVPQISCNVGFGSGVAV